MTIVVSPREIIRDYLEANTISLDMFIKKSKITMKQWNDFCNGNTEMSESIVDALFNLIPSVPKSYWCNLITKYKQYIDDEQSQFEVDESNLEDYAKKFKFDEVFSGLGYDRLKQAIEMLKMLGLRSFNDFYPSYSKLATDFMEDGGDLETIVIWLKMCEDEVYIQNEDVSSVDFDLNSFIENIDKFKRLALMEDERGIKINCRKLCNKYGINFVINGALTNSKVRGALTTINGSPSICISGRFKTHDHVWFAIMHEIGHLVLHYKEGEAIISVEDDEESNKELEANEFARNFFINQDDYLEFIKSEEYNTKAGVIKFSRSQKVHPGVVIGRLQHDKYLPMSSMNDLKVKFSLD